MLTLTFATHQEVCQALGQRLRAQRLAQLVGQQDLALKSGVSVGTVRTLEATGQTSLDSFVRVALALGLAEGLQHLFDPPVQSIAQMAKAEPPRRQRAPRRPRA